MLPMKAIVFDLDGTLVDSVPGITLAINQVVQQYGVELLTVDEIYRMVGKGAWELARRCLAHIGQEITPDLVDKFESAFVTHYQQTWQEGTPFFEGIKEMLQALQEAKIPCAILTNKPQIVTDEIVNVLFKDVFQFDYVYGASKEFPKKPDPTSLLHLIEQWGLQPEEVMYVGDSITDAETAQNAGMPCILVNWGYQEEFNQVCRAFKTDVVYSVPMLKDKLLGEGGLKVEPLRAADHDRVFADIESQFPAEELKSRAIYEELLSLGKFRLWGLYDTGELVGYFAGVYMSEKRVLWGDLFGIFPEYQSFGYGHKLVDAFMDQLPIDTIYFEVEKADPEQEHTLRRIKFYEKIGASCLFDGYVLPTETGGISMDLRAKTKLSEIPQDEWSQVIREVWDCIHIDVSDRAEIYDAMFMCHNSEK